MPGVDGSGRRPIGCDGERAPGSLGYDRDMKVLPVDREEFRARLSAICLESPIVGMPRRRRDRHILFRSVVMMLGPDRERDRVSLLEGLEAWLALVEVEIDAVSLRRYLVDDGYLERDRAGLRYVPRLAGRGGPRFEPDVDGIDVRQLLRHERIRIEAERRRPAAELRRRIWDDQPE